MLESVVDWNRDMGSAGTMNNSSQSTSMSSSSRSSFEAVVPHLPIPSSSSTCKKPSPHRWSSDPAWDAINRRSASGPLGPRDFKLLHHVGSGDVGTVYVCRLRSEDGVRHNDDIDDENSQLFAMKVVDKRELEKKKKLGRAEMERRVLRSIHHPFLPTLYADFDAAPHYSCFVMEFCPAGNLYSLRHRQPERRFDYNTARFYAAEVLVALEYLHMLGIIYRDLKPENVLIRPDGHVMLSDFDLTLECTSCPTLDTSSPSSSSPSCLPFFLSNRNKSKSKSKYRFTAEPVEARSFSFVGTHEYVAPEMAAGRSHGSAVDWWAFGVFVYELLHGRTPFVGPDDETTLRNIIRRRLVFPGPLDVDPRARDLITRLLAKDPARRLGSRRGATDVKAHPFFSGVNFALLRSQRPPIVPTGTTASPPKPSRFDYF